MAPPRKPSATPPIRGINTPGSEKSSKTPVNDVPMEKPPPEPDESTLIERLNNQEKLTSLLSSSILQISDFIEKNSPSINPSPPITEQPQTPTIDYHNYPRTPPSEANLPAAFEPASLNWQNDFKFHHFKLESELASDDILDLLNFYNGIKLSCQRASTGSFRNILPNFDQLRKRFSFYNRFFGDNHTPNPVEQQRFDGIGSDIGAHLRNPKIINETRSPRAYNFILRNNLTYNGFLLFEKLLHHLHPRLGANIPNFNLNEDLLLFTPLQGERLGPFFIRFEKLCLRFQLCFHTVPATQIMKKLIYLLIKDPNLKTSIIPFFQMLQSHLRNYDELCPHCPITVENVANDLIEIHSDDYTISIASAPGNVQSPTINHLAPEQNHPYYYHDNETYYPPYYQPINAATSVNYRQRRGPTITCNACTMPGHTADQCYHRSRKFRPEWLNKRIEQYNAVHGYEPKGEIRDFKPRFLEPIPPASSSKYKHHKPPPTNDKRPTKEQAATINALATDHLFAPQESIPPQDQALIAALSHSILNNNSSTDYSTTLQQLNDAANYYNEKQVEPTISSMYAIPGSPQQIVETPSDAESLQNNDHTELLSSESSDDDSNSFMSYDSDDEQENHPVIGAIYKAQEENQKHVIYSEDPIYNPDTANILHYPALYEGGIDYNDPEANDAVNFVLFQAINNSSYRPESIIKDLTHQRLSQDDVHRISGIHILTHFCDTSQPDTQAPVNATHIIDISNPEDTKNPIIIATTETPSTAKKISPVIFNLAQDNLPGGVSITTPKSINTFASLLHKHPLDANYNIAQSNLISNLPSSAFTPYGEIYSHLDSGANVFAGVTPDMLYTYVK